jgi:hypothetical protein
MTPDEVAKVMEPLEVWWGIAGGWAIDLWLGRVTREHHDIEVVVRRADQRLLHDRLVNEWDMRFIDPPGSGWRPWDGGRFDGPAFQATARRGDEQFDVFFEDVARGEWTFRRDPTVRRPIEEVIQQTISGIPVVRPEVQLLYMAGHAEAKNWDDFVRAVPELDGDARTWLRRSLRHVAPDHLWLAQLDG